MQKLVAKGVEFPMGVPPGEHLNTSVHRENLQPTLAPRIEVFAKKLRDYYFKEGILPEQKTYLGVERERRPDDSMEKLLA
jgi:hypothetical protein